MPIYEYKCEDCGNIFEILTTSNTITEKLQCSECNSEKVKKVMSAGSFRLDSAGSLPSAPPTSCGGGSGFS